MLPGPVGAQNCAPRVERDGMAISRRLVLVMVLLLALPVSVAALAAIGLWRLDRILARIAEEYEEARMLQPIDRALSAAVALDAQGPEARAIATNALRDAEAALVRYLATQYDSVATVEHQASESSHAAILLSRLQQLLSEQGRSATPLAQTAEVRVLHSEFEAILDAADRAVESAHQQARSARDATVTAVYAASLATTALCLGLVVWSTRSVSRRLRELHGTLSVHAPGPQGPAPRDMGGVVTQIERMNGLLIQRIEESGRELLRRERLAGIGLLAADVAHEINNPMNAMLGLSELGLRTLEHGPLGESDRQELQESLRVVRREAMRCRGIIERLMSMVRSDRQPSWFDATRLLRETVQVAQAARPDKANCFILAGSGVSVRAYGPADDVRQIMLTLLINAADAIASDGRIEVDATQTEQEIWLRVRDNGRGFTEAMQQSFFTPFKSFSENGAGAGLGLSIAQALADGMGASLRAFSDGPGRGSMFILALRAPKDVA